jgi:hypothetical protein
MFYLCGEMRGEGLLKQGQGNHADRPRCDRATAVHDFWSLGLLEQILQFKLIIPIRHIQCIL